MKKLNTLLLISAMLGLSIAVVAQTQLASWPYFVELDSTPNAGVYQLTMPLHVMGQSRDDLADLRLFDAENHEIPYAIRVLQTTDQRQESGTRIFNRSTVGSASEATVDLGANAEHNEVEIQTTGQNFRRRVAIEGSNNGQEWRTLRTDGVIFGFQSDGKTVDSNRVSYPSSRYRYLRVRLNSDELSDDQAPEIADLKVSMSVHEEGVLSTWDVPVPSYQLLRNQGAHATSWTIDFGSRLPCSQLTLIISDPSFFRPFQVENVDDPQNPRLIANGNLSRRAIQEVKPQVITFDQEEHVQRLRLQVTDYSNQTLSIEGITASAPVRQLVFELKQPQTFPLRLYFGNQKISEPHYDFENELTAKLKAKPIAISAGAIRQNPVFTPEPLPFTERAPWLIYLVLAASSLVLGWILFSLTRTTLRREGGDGTQGQEQ
jgi:hypothetical protein